MIPRWPELRDWRWYACIGVAVLLEHLGPLAGGVVAGSGATAFYLHFIRDHQP